MKKILTFIAAVSLMLIATEFSANAQRTVINLSEVHLDASWENFKKASQQNKTDILVELMRQANLAYEACETIEEVYELKERLVNVQTYQDYHRYKKRSMAVQNSINTLNTKLNKTIREYEGGVLVMHDRENTRLY